MGQDLGALVSLFIPVWGEISLPSRYTRMMDAMLTRVHGVVAIQGQLVHMCSVLALAKQLEDGQFSLLLVMLIKEQAMENDRAMALF